MGRHVYAATLLVILSIFVVGCTSIPQVNAQAALKPAIPEATKAYVFEVIPDLADKEAITLKCGFNWLAIKSERKLSGEIEVRDTEVYLILSASQAKVKLSDLNSPVTWDLVYLGTEKLYLSDTDVYLHLTWKDLDSIIKVNDSVCE